LNSSNVLTGSDIASFNWDNLPKQMIKNDEGEVISHTARSVYLLITPQVRTDIKAATRFKLANKQLKLVDQKGNIQNETLDPNDTDNLPYTYILDFLDLVITPVKEIKTIPNPDYVPPAEGDSIDPENPDNQEPTVPETIQKEIIVDYIYSCPVKDGNIQARLRY
jgi:hypothetical protein